MSKFPTNVAITYTALAQTQGMPGNTFTYAWTFDDGGTGNTASLAHTWATDGNHSAAITATDTVTGGAASALKSIATSSATWVGNTAQNRSWQAMVYGNGLFVAAANDGLTGVGGIMTSTDGVTWSPRTSPVAANFNSVAYGNGTFVVVGTSTGNWCIYSTDGITWNIPTFPNKQWECVAYGAGLFVALSYLNGVANQAMTSPDGITWTSRNTSSDQQWSAICYGGGQFVALCNGSAVMTSPDGITWTTRTGIAESWVGIAYGNGIYLAVANVVTSGQLMWSKDGITWNSASTPDLVQIASVSFGNGSFCITPTTTGLSWGSYITQDCVTFYKINTGVSNGVWFASAYGVDRFVAVSHSLSTQRAQVLVW